MLIALVVYDGVLNAECEAFTSVLGLLERAEVITVGARAGRVAGPGGSQSVDVRFDDVDRVDVAVVPGGLGCERAADDPELRAFLIRTGATARYLVASSTGSVVLASAGLLHGQPAATHWLAHDLLRRYGSEADDRQLAAHGNVITCVGQISAVDAAFSIVERLAGPDEVRRIRAALIERGQPLLRPASRWRQLADRVRGLTGRTDSHVGSTSVSTAARPPVTPLSVMIELVDNDELARELERSSRRRR